MSESNQVFYRSNAAEDREKYGDPGWRTPSQDIPEWVILAFDSNPHATHVVASSGSYRDGGFGSSIYRTEYRVVWFRRTGQRKATEERRV